jgi:hypothetical protein
MNPVQELMDSLSGDPGFLDKISANVGDRLLKADAFTGGANGQQLVWYNLNPTIHLVYPYLEQVPLMIGNPEKGIAPIARTKSTGGTACHWKTITAIDPDTIAGGVGRGQRGGAMRVTSNDVSAPFYGMGVEVPTDFETVDEGGQLNPKNLEIAMLTGLQALMIRSEKMAIGGNSTLALGTTPTPTVTDGAATGGTVTTVTTLSVIVIALTNDGYLRASVTGGVPAAISRQNMDGSTANFGGGSARKSAAGTTSITASHTYLATVAPVSGAVAYAWYWGAAGSETLGAITTIAGIEIKTDAGGTQLASAMPAADNSKDGLIPDGLITQMTGTTFGGASNSYVKYVANGTGAGGAAGTVGGGNGLTGDGSGGVKEFDALLKDRWDNYRIGFKNGLILINSQEAQNITTKILTQPTGVTSLFRVTQQYDAQGRLMGGKRLESYHNKFTDEDIDVQVHPWVPPGTVIFYSTRVPYPLPEAPNLLEFEERRGFYQINWPWNTRQYQSGFYWDGAFKNHFPPAFALLSNIGNN